ncbi:hypothetical protein PENSPDRAFT_641660 [Peniophora sp. CONT]|nr:hypothetical protein PENSPDRAFT_641660 [Peniophora sp. CONT]
MDSYAVAALAHVRVLLVPIGSISKRTFDQWAAEIRTIDAIRLSDIPPGTKDEKARFMPSPKSKGYIHLNYPSHPPPPSHFNLSMFRPSLFPLGVIGIASCSRSDSLTSILAEFNAVMKEMFPSDSIYPLARNCFIFEEDDGSTNLNLGDLLPGLVVIPSAMGNKKENIETLLADLCSNLLGEFSTIIGTLETPLGNEFLNAGMFPRMPLPSELPKPLDDGAAPGLLPSHNSQPELSAVSRRQSLMPTRTASTGPGMSTTAVNRQSTMGMPGPRKSAIGTASSHGRLFKVLGDLFLLSGRTEDASIWYTEAIALFKAHPDNVWHAAALEGLATVSILDSWTSDHSSAQASTTGAGDPWSGLIEKLEQATALYAKAAPTSDDANTYSLLSYAYCLSTVRHASLLAAIWSAKGWGQFAWSIMLNPSRAPPLPHASTPASRLERDKLSSISGVTRASIGDALSNAHGPWLLHLGHRERISLLEKLASTYAALGYHRKEVYIMREVIGCIMDLVVVGRAEGQASANGGYDPQTTDSPRSTHAHDTNTSLAVRENERADGNRSIISLIRYICKMYGIDLESVRLVDPLSSADEADASLEEQQTLEDPFGWPELQVGIIREALAVAEALPDPSAVAQFSFSALKSLYSVLTNDDQYTIFMSASRALTAAHRRGDQRIVEYWSGQPIVSIEMIPAPNTRQVVENPVSLLSKAGAVSVVTPAKDPFLYNPRRSLLAQGKTLVVEGEPLEFVVTLSNPYVFDLELQNLSLSTSGVPFTAYPTQVTIPPVSLHTVTLHGSPAETGILTIRGCIVQAPGGAPREFVLPMSTPEEDDHAARRRSSILLERDRTKFGGIGSAERKRASITTSSTVSASKGPKKYLECKVVPEQPAIRIRWSSLAHGALMLYDGERSTIRLTLENVGALPVDLLRLTFDDNTIAPAQAALSEGDLSVFEMYETEFALVHRPAFTWDAAAHEGRVIAPGAKDVIIVTCTGKVGCMSGSVNVAYGYVNRKQSNLIQPAEVFHTRTLSYPVLVTVYQMLECWAMDIIPFTPSEVDLGGPETAWKALVRDAEEDGWCLFSVDVRNTYGLPFEVTFDRVQEGTPPASTSYIVPPGSTTRILLPLKKFLLPEEVVARAIPTLSDRQFVIDKSGLSTAAVRAQRELFWYREALLETVRARWREVGSSGRAGELSLRQQRLTYPMLECLRTETARVGLSLWLREDDEWTELPRRDGRFMPPPNEFVYVRLEAENKSPQPLALTLDLNIEPSEYILCDGSLADVPLGRLAPGAHAQAELAVCFMACGRFTLEGSVRVMGAPPDEARVGLGTLRVLVENA